MVLLIKRMVPPDAGSGTLQALAATRAKCDLSLE
jgi:hypothetical protein